MAINRKGFLKTLGGVGLGLLAGPLAAGSIGQQSANASSQFALARNEDKHLVVFLDQLRSSASPLSEASIAGFQPVSLVKRKTGIRGYHFEYMAKNGCRITMTRKNGKQYTKVAQAA